jgi:predicted dehydrogenase
VKIEELEIDDVEPLRAQLEAFVASVRNGVAAEVTAEEGLAAVDVASQIVKSIAPGMML